MVNEIMNFIAQHDPEVGKAIEAEYARQKRNIELIASENIVSEAVMAAMGTVLTNKYAEGFLANVITADASASMLLKILRLNVRKNCSRQNMLVFSHTPVQAQISQFILLC